MKDFIEIQYAPGTAKSDQQTEITTGAFTDTDQIRFNDDGKLTTIPPYSNAQINDIQGRNRSIYGQRLTGSNEADYFFFGTHSHLFVRKNSVLYNITPLKASATTLGAAPLATTNTDATVVVTHTGHGYIDGDRIKMDGASAVGGILVGALNKEHIITYIDANSYSIEATAATSTTTGGGTVLVYGQIDSGNAVQSVGSGMGAGDFGSDHFGEGGTSATGITIFPRIWSFDAYGNNVVMCPGDYTAGEGQNIFIWDGDTEIAPTIWTNAPTDCNWIMVVNNAPIALCGSTVKMAGLNPGGIPYWSGTTYREKTLERIDRAHSGFVHNEKEAIIHHGDGAILLRWVGGSALWDLTDVYEDDGVVSPMSTGRAGHKMVWRGRRGFLMYDGGVVQQIVNKQNMDWILDNVRSGCEWQSFAMMDTQNAEIYFYFCTGSDDEPGDYVIFSTRSGSFTLGKMNRTAAQRPNMLSDQYYMSYSSSSSTSIYKHLTQGAFTEAWYAETSFSYMGKGNYRFSTDKIHTDHNADGDITLEVITREFGDNTDISAGIYTITPEQAILDVAAAGHYVKFKFSGSNATTLGKWRHNGRRQGTR